LGLPVVAILGRPNVGKSTLFNRLAGAGKAVVDDTPGVTRDRNYAIVETFEREYVLIDTGGIVLDSREGIELTITKQAEIASREADLIILLIEKIITPEDIEIARKFRREDLPVMLVVNKVDRERDEIDVLEAWNLGLGEPIAISAHNGRGVADMLSAMINKLPATGKGEQPHSETRIAIVGKPNVGKSSFVNRLLGEEKLVVDPTPGTTRDAIDTPFEYKGKRWLLTDTAGLFKKRQTGIDYYSSLRTVTAIKHSDIALLLIDASEPFTHQDKHIAGMAMEFYKGLIIGLNKWDLVEAGDKTAAHMERDIKEADTFLGFVPFITVSALTGKRVTKVLDLVEEVAEERKKRIPTSELNSLIENEVKRIPPPVVMGKRSKILYVTQEQADPPIFIFFCKGAEYIPNNYKRFLTNILRREYGFVGVPLKMVFRERK
jgi:GTP-binding protein